MGDKERWWKSHQWINIYLSRYFAACGLLNEAERMLDDLPHELSEELGGDEEFWKNSLSSSSSKVNRLNLLCGALEFAINKAESLSRKHGRPFCFYLRRALENKWPSHWLIGMIRSTVPLEKLKKDNITRLQETRGVRSDIMS